MLVERQRRRQDRGNPFSPLQTDNLYQIARDVNLKFGNTNHEASQTIEQLIADNQACYENLIDHNPDVMLPAELNFDSDQAVFPLEGIESGTIDDNPVVSPKETFKVLTISPPWTEVVRRGKNRGKCKN
jgi:hypothetical protein